MLVTHWPAATVVWIAANVHPNHPTRPLDRHPFRAWTDAENSTQQAVRFQQFTSPYRLDSLKRIPGCRVCRMKLDQGNGPLPHLIP